MRRMVTTLLLPVLAGAQDVIVLRNGQSTVGEFLSGGRMTYHFDLPADSQSDVAIAVTPLSGSDPDLCISQTITRPDPLTGTCRWSGDSAGADRVLNPYRVGGTRLAITALKPTVTDFIDASLSGSSIELELAEVVVHPSSDLAGKTLAGAEVRQRFGIIVVALKRGEESTFNPGPNERIEAGDVLVALGPIQALERIEKATQ